MYHIFFIHSSADGHVSCFHVLAVVTSAAVNIGVQIVSFLPPVARRWAVASAQPIEALCWDFDFECVKLVSEGIGILLSGQQRLHQAAPLQDQSCNSCFLVPEAKLVSAYFWLEA